MKKKPTRFPAVVVFEQGDPKNKDHIKITVDRCNWTLSGSYFSSNTFFSRFQELVRFMYQSSLKTQVRALELEKVRHCVAETEDYLVEMAKEVGERFAQTPFRTPERRHEEQKIENNRPRQKKKSELK